MLRKKKEITDLYVRDYPNCESERLSPVKPDRPVKQDQLKRIATLSHRINFNCAEDFASSGLFHFGLMGSQLSLSNRLYLVIIGHKPVTQRNDVINESSIQALHDT